MSVMTLRHTRDDVFTANGPVTADVSEPVKAPPAKRSNTTFERWQKLIIADRNGERGAYDQFLRELITWLNGYFRRRIHDGGVEDAVQETILAVLARRLTYSTSDPLGPWLLTLAHHKWVDTVRQRTRATLVPIDDTIPITDHGDSVRSAIVVEDALSSLKRPQRDVIVYRLIEGFSVAETAARTGQSESLVKVNVHRGMKRMAITIGMAL